MEVMKLKRKSLKKNRKSSKENSKKRKCQCHYKKILIIFKDNTQLRISTHQKLQKSTKLKRKQM